jgi:enoyl-CoA hydratase
VTHAIRPVDFDNLKTMTYEVTDRVARITFNRPEKGNAIIADTPLELSALVERADLDPAVHVILVSGRGEGFCAGFDLSAYAEGSSSAGGGSPYKDTVLSGKTQAINHLPDQPWDPMIDYQMMSRFVRGFSSLMHADKPTVPPPTPRSVTRPPGYGECRRRVCGRIDSATNAPNAFC